MADGPSPEEITAAARVLAKLRPGFLPFDIFIQFTRLMVASVVEVVPLRRKSGKVEVLLLPRGSDDTLWPNMVHTPGTLLRATDRENSFEDAFDRIREETGGISFVGHPVFVQAYVRKSRRGMENSRVFYVEVAGSAVKGAFCAVDALPNNLVPGQRAFIRAAAVQFLAGVGVDEQPSVSEEHVSGLVS